MEVTGNTVGSSSVHFWNFFINPNHAYILGLWCADSYHRTSSVGLSSIRRDLIERFRLFLLETFVEDRLRLRIYCPANELGKFRKDNYTDLAKNIVCYPSKKAKHPGLQLYVNSRSLLRAFRSARDRVSRLKDGNCLAAYFAGRFDGDGSVGKDLRRDCRIVYGGEEEACIDKALLEKLGFEKAKVYHYKTAHTFCLYISRYETTRFLGIIRAHSVLVPKMYTRTP